MSVRLVAAGHRSPADSAGELFPMTSAAPRSPYWTRSDPWDEVWLWASQPRFHPRFSPRPVYDPDGQWLRTEANPTYLDPDADEQPSRWHSWSRLLTNDRVATMLSLLARMHHAHVWQLGAWSGVGRTDIWKYLGPLYDYGLVQRGKYALTYKIPGKQPYIYTLNSDAPLRRWLADRARLDRDKGEDRVYEVLGNREGKVAGGNKFARHNQLTLEVVLRLLEVQPNLVAVAGETDATPARVTGLEGAPKMPADAVLWRHDGLRILLEVVSANDMRHLRSKMERWASWFVSVPYEQSGTVLVWLNANTDDHAAVANRMRRAFKDATAPGKLRHPDGTVATQDETSRVRRQMMLASWSDWFSGRAVTMAGAEMVCAASPETDRWAPVPLANDKAWVNPAGACDPFDVTSPVFVPGWCGQLPVASVRESA